MADKYGVTPEGFVLKTLPEIYSDVETRIRGIFGTDIDLSEQTPDGQEVGLFSASHALVWEVAQENYNAFDPAKASGVSLDGIVKINGLSRIPESYSSVVLTCAGTSGTVIPIGSEVSNAAETVVFKTALEAAIPIEGAVTVTAFAADAGPVYASASSLITILTPISGWDTVTNEDDAIPGRLREVDSELRLRRERSVAASSQALTESVLGALSNLDGVSHAEVVENATGNVVDTVPPHAIECIVHGGASADIADAIYKNKSIGCETFGSESVTVVDSQGTSHIIYFTRPESQDIHLWIHRVALEGYVSSNDEEIKDNIVLYSLGELPQLGDTRYRPGDDVYGSHLYSPINLVPDQTVSGIYMKVGQTPDLGDTTDIYITARQLALFDRANITVSAVAPQA